MLFSLPPNDAIRFFARKQVLTRAEFDKLSETQRYYAFTVSQVSEQKLLEDIHETVLSHLKSGAPRRELEKELQRRLPTFTQNRVQLIAHQNLRQAAMAGRFEQMWRSRDVLPYVQWKTMGDDRVRPEHRALHNQIWRLEDIPFWPPLGFNCRCWVIQLSERQIKGQQIIRGPDTYTTVDGGEMKIRRVSDPASYSLNKKAMEFDFTDKPEPLARAHLKAAGKKPEPPGTVEGFELAAQEWQKKQRGKKEIVARLRYDQPPPMPSWLAWWDGKDISFSPASSEQLRATLSLLARGQRLTVEQTDRLADAYHELLHSLGDQDFTGSGKPSHALGIEIVNELHTRLRLGRFVRDLGYDPSLVRTKELIAGAVGYGDLIPDVRTALEAVGIGRVEAAAFFERLNLQEKTTTYLERIVGLIAGRLSLPAQERARLLADFISELDATGRAVSFRQDIVRRAAKRRIRPALWV